jgi:hypothetical protein
VIDQTSPDSWNISAKAARLGRINVLMQCNAISLLCMAFDLGIHTVDDYGRAPWA